MLRKEKPEKEFFDILKEKKITREDNSRDNAGMCLM